MTWKNLASPVSSSSSSPRGVRLLHSESPAVTRKTLENIWVKQEQPPREDRGRSQGEPHSNLLRPPHRSRLHWGLKEDRAFSSKENTGMEEDERW